MNTLRLALGPMPFDPLQLETPEAQEALNRAAEILRDGGLVAFPTETVYGLGAHALDPAAVQRIFAAKQRPAWDPVIVHIADSEQGKAMLKKLVSSVPDAACKLMKAFWPGPLTLLLPRSSVVPDEVTAGRPLIGVRMPAHPAALELIRRAGVPIAAPSANTFSHTSPTSADHVLADLDGRIDAVIDAGSTLHGVESTVLDPNQSPMILYRPGAVTSAQIREIAGAVEVFRAEPQTTQRARTAMPAPGVGLKHYAPAARLILVDAPQNELAYKLSEEKLRWPGERVGVLLPEDLTMLAPGAIPYAWGRWSAPEELAHALYSGLRALDAQGCTVILCPVPKGDGLAAAIRDRLTKAACPDRGK